MSARRRPTAVLLVLVAMLLAAGCSGVSGSGRLVTTEIDPGGGFDRIQSSSGFQVDVTIGERDSATVEADDNLAGRLDAGVSGGTLRLGLEPGLNVGTATLRARVTVRSLRAVDASGASAVRVVGEVRGDGIDVTLSGASQLDADVQVSTAALRASGTSEVRLTGSARTVTASASGASSLTIDELEADRVSAEVTGASEARVWATGSLEATASGASQLRYKGSPDIERQDSSGGSSIEPI